MYTVYSHNNDNNVRNIGTFSTWASASEVLERQRTNYPNAEVWIEDHNGNTYV